MKPPESVRTKPFWQSKSKKIYLSIMAGVFLLILIITAIYFGVCRSENVAINQAEATLQYASIIFRHGDRTPTELYNSDPHKNYNWPGGLGALTNLGKQQLYNLGSTIRARYRNFLPDYYSDDDIYVKSSDKSRTLMSAYTFLAGLYPPVRNQTWNSDILWQPIPVHSVPREMDKVLAAKKSCNEYDRHRKLMFESQEYQKLNDSLKDLYELLTVKANQSFDNPLKIETLYNTLCIEKDFGLILPKWAEEQLDRMRPIAAISLSWSTFDEFMIRVKSGPLLSEIIENMKKKVVSDETKSKQKMMIYSAHDVTLINFMRALHYREYMMPDYGATFVVELHKTEEATPNFEVKFLYYNNTYTTEPYRMEIPKCNSPCLLSKFEEVSAEYIPVDWEKECGNQ